MLYSKFFIFILSIFLAALVVYVERLVGIEWDFHPDANTYISHSTDVLENFNIRHLLGASFYVWVGLLGSEIWLVITFNVIFYALTNVALIGFLKRHVSNYRNWAGLLFLLVVFNPYRIHLSVHVLKDTLIIFGLVYFLTSRRAYSWVFLLFSYLFSMRAVIYLMALLRMRKKHIILVSIPVALFLLTLPTGFLSSTFSTETQVNMTFRDFDTVPNFFEFGFLGAIARAVVWPFLYLTGLFILLSPGVLYFPIALWSIFLQFWHVRQYGGLTFYFQVYLSMAILAFMVSGFTSFVRYALPLITILPLLVIIKNTAHER